MTVRCSSCGDTCSGGLKCRDESHPLCIPCSMKDDRYGDCVGCRSEKQEEIRQNENEIAERRRRSSSRG